MSKPKYPPIGSKVKCLKAPHWASAETSEKMIGQIGTVDEHWPEESQYGPCIGIQYPWSPHRDNRIVHTLRDEGEMWERIKP